MKVCLHMSPSSDSLGGAEVFVAHLAALLRAEHDVEIVHHRQWLDIAELAAFSGIELGGVTARALNRRPSYWYSTSSNPFAMYRAPRAWGHELAGDADVFITVTHELPPLNTAPVGVAIVLFPMSSPFEAWPFAAAGGNRGLRAALADAFYRRQYGRLWRSFTRTVAVSEFAAEWTRRRWRTPCEVLYPLVDGPVSAAPRVNQVLTLGRFSVSGVSKEQRAMATAFSQSAGRLPGWRLAALGEARTPGEAAYAAEVAAQGDRVIVLRNASRQDVLGELARSRVYWHAAGLAEDPDDHPEYLEHFGIATVEAMAHGCVPVVIGRGGQPEIVEHGRSGFLCASLDEMVARTAQLAADAGLWQQMSSAARVRAEAFGRDAFVARLREVVPALFTHGSASPLSATRDAR